MVLHNFCVEHKPDLLFLSEPWILIDHFPVRFWRRLNLKPFVVNNSGDRNPDIWGICACHINPTVLAVSIQHVSAFVLDNEQLLFISAVYACTS